MVKDTKISTPKRALIAKQNHRIVVYFFFITKADSTLLLV